MAGIRNGEFSPEFQHESLGEAEAGIGAAHEGMFEDEMEAGFLGEDELHESHEFGQHESHEFGQHEQHELGYHELNH